MYALSVTKMKGSEGYRYRYNLKETATHSSSIYYLVQDKVSDFTMDTYILMV